MNYGTAVLIQRRNYDSHNLMDEFKSLAKTAGYEVIGEFDIVSPPSARYGISSGKAEEIATWIEVNNPDVALYTPSLKSSQVFRLMELWEIEVRDRTQLILEIFDRHAQTQQAKLQIEQARLSYELPFERHQIRMRLQQEHTGDRPIAEQIGAGEDLLNLRIKEIRRRISTIRSKLKDISESQKLIKKRRIRKGFLEVTLAGYTNAGKSTLHRSLTGSTVEIADELFTTLSTKAARLDLSGRRAVLSDSVGFISDLPKELLDSFNTTLMEIADADVIVLVIDGSDDISEIKRKSQTCFDTFNEVGINGIPIVIALNKIDLISNDDLVTRSELLTSYDKQIVPISAFQEVNLDELLSEIDSALPDMHRYSITLPIGDIGMSVLSWLHEVSEVENENYTQTAIEVDAYLTSEVRDRLSKKLPQGVIHRIGQNQD
jgi:GTP-binding protein HflX